MDLLHLVDFFRINTRPESDHFPQETALYINLLYRKNIAALVKMPETHNQRRLKWRGTNFKQIMDTVHKHVENTGSQSAHLLEQDWENLGTTLLNKFPVIPASQLTIGARNEPWYNIQLRDLKKKIATEVRAKAIAARMGIVMDNSKIIRMRTEYKDMCREAKRVHTENLWEKLLWASKMPNSSEFWGLINNLTKGIGTHLNVGISDSVWTQHIDKLYNNTQKGTHTWAEISLNKMEDVKQKATSIGHSKLEKVQSEGDQMKPIIQDLKTLTTIKQLKVVIKKLKPAGAAGPNGLPNGLFKQEPDFLGQLPHTTF